MKTVELDITLSQMLATLRGSLGQVPEPSNREAVTSSIIGGFLASYAPNALIRNLGGYGIAAVYEGSNPGPTVLVRAELDAIPVESALDLTPRLFGSGHEHRCGHDAHMTMVAGLAPLLHRRRPAAGRVVLLFQPAEETGEGAQSVIADPAFMGLEPDFSVGLHNLPGYPRGTVIVRGGVFACASVGMRVELQGEPSHAAEPELGTPPAPALGELLSQLPTLSRPEGEGFRLLTITHSAMGRASFGVSPGHAQLFATLRAHTGEELATVREAAEALVIERAEAHDLRAQVSWQDDFPETRNDHDLVEVLETICDELEVPHVRREQPMRWSDDFGHFASLCPSVYFGLGIGEAAAGLHQEGYAFPNTVLPTGVELLHRFATRLLSVHRGDRAPAHVIPRPSVPPPASG